MKDYKKVSKLVFTVIRSNNKLHQTGSVLSSRRQILSFDIKSMHVLFLVKTILFEHKGDWLE